MANELALGVRRSGRGRPKAQSETRHLTDHAQQKTEEAAADAYIRRPAAPFGFAQGRLLPSPLGVVILYQSCPALSNHLALLFDQRQDAQAQRVHRLALVLVERAVLQGIEQG